MKGAVRRRIVRRPLTAALSPIVKDGKRNAPHESKALRKSIGKKVRVYKDAVFGAVGPRTGERFSLEHEGQLRVPSRYAHLVELGTKNRAGDPFLRKALAQNRSKALRIQAAGIKKNILKEAAKR